MHKGHGLPAALAGLLGVAAAAVAQKFAPV